MMEARKRGPLLRGRRPLLEWGFVGLISALLVLGLSLSTFADRANYLAYDSLIRAQAGPSRDDILIVAIDDRSLEALGRWPWPRSVHAKLIETMAPMKPLAIGYDVLFIEPSTQDDLLAQAIQKAGNVYMPLLIDAPGPNGAPWLIQAPASPISKAALALGHVNLHIDSDGTVRRLPLYMQTGSTVWPHLTVLMAQAAKDNSKQGPDLTAPSPIPDDTLLAREPMAIAYRGGPGHHRTVSFVDVLNGEIPASFIRDHLVLVGTTAAGLGDRYATPSAPDGELMRGVEVQASLLQTLLDGRPPHSLGFGWSLLLSLLPLALLMAGFLYLPPRINMWLGLGLMGLVLGLCAGLFLGAQLWFAPVPALAGLILAYPLWSWRRLVSASSYMRSELLAVEIEERTRQGLPPILPSLPDQQGGDVVTRQVNALRSALRRLRDFDRFIQDAVRSLPDATMLADRHGHILLANDRAKALFGEQVQPGQSVDHLFQSLGEPAWQRLLEAEPADIGDLNSPSGLVLRPAAARLADSSGSGTGYILRLTDMTHIRAIERQREYAVQLLTHDLRAPQVSILTLLNAQPEQAENQTNRRIAANAQLTLDLAEGYVQLARAESQAYRSEEVDMVQVAMDAADTLWPQASAKGVSIQTHADSDDCFVIGDPGLLRRLIMNLLDNGLKYSPAGETLDCHIHTYERDGKTFCDIRVRDRGQGLSPQAAERLFQPFGQGGQEMTGVGLGLAFVHTVTLRHGGQIRYEDAQPGAAFVVTLPRIVWTDEDSQN